MDATPNDVWAGPKPKKLGFLYKCGQDDLTKRVVGPIGARIDRKGFEHMTNNLDSR